MTEGGREEVKVCESSGGEETISPLWQVKSIQEDEHLQIRKVNNQTHFVQIFSYTAGCNWLDVVEVQFREGEESGGWTHMHTHTHTNIQNTHTYTGSM